MMRRTLKLLSFLAVIGLARAAVAADLPPVDAQPAPTPFFLHIGPAGIFLNETAKIRAAGNLIPGASLRVAPQLTVAAEVGYFLNRNIAVSFTGGYPPTVEVMGRGAIAGLGRLGGVTYGPATLTAHYHFVDFGRFQPYIGAGPTFMVVFGASDGALTQLKLANSIGFAVQVGADYMIDDHWGLFVDVKKAYLRSISTGYLGPIPTKSIVQLDPLVVHSGLTYRF